MRLWGRRNDATADEGGLDATLQPLFDYVITSLKGAGFDPASYPSDTYASFDLSGSVEDSLGQQRLYSGRGRTMQGVGSLVAASAFALSGGTNRLWASFFNDATGDIGEVRPANARNFLDCWKDHPVGGTKYIPVINWMLQKSGFPALDWRLIEAWARALRDNDFSHVQPLTPQAWTKRSKLGVLVSDGQPQHDDWWELIAAFYLASQYPLFIQCVGVGQDEFPHFDTFNDLPVQSENNPFGRVFDNVGAFDSRRAQGDPRRMLGLMLGEYPQRYGDMLRLGMLRPSH